MILGLPGKPESHRRNTTTLTHSYIQYNKPSPSTHSDKHLPKHTFNRRASMCVCVRWRRWISFTTSITSGQLPAASSVCAEYSTDSIRLNNSSKKKKRTRKTKQKPEENRNCILKSEFQFQSRVCVNCLGQLLGQLPRLLCLPSVR